MNIIKRMWETENELIRRQSLKHNIWFNNLGLFERIDNLEVNDVIYDGGEGSNNKGMLSRYNIFSTGAKVRKIDKKNKKVLVYDWTPISERTNLRWIPFQQIMIVQSRDNLKPRKKRGEVIEK